MADLKIEGASLERGGAVLVDQANLVVQPGEFVALLGPNGAGKTSFIQVALGLAAASAGTCLLDGRPVSDMGAVERARLCAYLPQSRPLAWPNSVRDVVALGRFAYGAAMGRLRPEDAEAVRTALAECNIVHLADRQCDTLSGGELARVHFARARASRAPLLIADEPIAALDLRHQFQILDLIKAYTNSGGGALVILHDVALAARYASRLVWMNNGRVVADGTPGETLTENRMADIFGVRTLITGHDIRIEATL